LDNTESELLSILASSQGKKTVLGSPEDHTPNKISFVSLRTISVEKIPFPDSEYLGGAGISSSLTPLQTTTPTQPSREEEKGGEGKETHSSSAENEED